MTLNLANASVEELAKFSISELESLQKKVAKAINERKTQDKIAFHTEVRELAAKRGVSLNEYLETPPKKMKIAKYKNPANPKEVWAGRGRKPNWLLDLLAAGRNLDEFLA